MRQFDSLRASNLYCAKCGDAMPVRERLLLVLPGKDLYEYVCAKCGTSVGKREVEGLAKVPTASPSAESEGSRLYLP